MVYGGQYSAEYGSFPVCCFSYQENEGIFQLFQPDFSHTAGDSLCYICIFLGKFFWSAWNAEQIFVDFSCGGYRLAGEQLWDDGNGNPIHLEKYWISYGAVHKRIKQHPGRIL